MPLFASSYMTNSGFFVLLIGEVGGCSSSREAGGCSFSESLHKLHGVLVVNSPHVQHTNVQNIDMTRITWTCHDMLDSGYIVCAHSMQASALQWAQCIHLRYLVPGQSLSRLMHGQSRSGPARYHALYAVWDLHGRPQLPGFRLWFLLRPCDVTGWLRWWMLGRGRDSWRAAVFLWPWPTLSWRLRTIFWLYAPLHLPWISICPTPSCHALSINLWPTCAHISMMSGMGTQHTWTTKTSPEKKQYNVMCGMPRCLSSSSAKQTFFMKSKFLWIRADSLEKFASSMEAGHTLWPRPVYWQPTLRWGGWQPSLRVVTIASKTDMYCLSSSIHPHVVKDEPHKSKSGEENAFGSDDSGSF